MLHALSLTNAEFKVLKMQNRNILENLNYCGTKMFLMFKLIKCLPTLNVLFTNKKKVISV